MQDPSNAAVGMLPLPRIPSRPRWPSADAVAGLAGEALAAPIRPAEAAQREAQDAVADVETHRPGVMGAKWREALEADAAAHAAGKPPAKWAAATLLEEDPQRWATARVLCGALAGVWRRADEALDRAGIREAAAKAAQDAADRFAQVARDGWNARQDPHVAWPLKAQGDALIAEYRAAQSLVDWCDGAGYDPANSGQMPTDRAARGHWLCLDMVLNPKKKLLGIPRDVVWPEGADRLLGMAIPAGRGFAELRRDGYYETAEVV